MFEPQPLTKLEAFERKLEEEVLSGQIVDNFGAYELAIGEGHLGRHAAAVLRRLKKEGKVSYDSSHPRITYDAVHREEAKVIFKLQYEQDRVDRSNMESIGRL